MNTAKSHSAVFLVLLIVVPPLLWAGNIIVGRVIHADISAVSLTFFRWCVALVVLLPLAANPLIKTWRDFLPHWKALMLTAFTGVSAFNLLVYAGLQHTTANNAALLNAFIPMLILLFATLFLKQRASSLQMLGLLLSFAGVMTIVSQGKWETIARFAFNQGDIAIFIATASWAVYTLTLRRLPPHLNRLALVCIQIMIGLLILLPVVLTEQLFFSPDNHWLTSTFLGVLYVGIGPSVIAYMMYAKCVETIGPARAGMSIHLIPVFGVMLAYVLLGEPVKAYHWAGFALVFGGIALAR